MIFKHKHNWDFEQDIVRYRDGCRVITAHVFRCQKCNRTKRVATAIGKEMARGKSQVYGEVHILGYKI